MTFRRVGVLIVIASMVPGGPAQPKKARAQTTADSAAVARTAWASAARALHVNDLATARKEIAHAAAAWPTQQAYPWARAVLAARARDIIETRRALADYAALGLGRDLRADTTFSAFAHEAWFESLVKAHDANRTVIARSEVRATLSDSTLWPEGVDYDPRTGKYYIASIRHRTIVELSPNGSERELLPRDAAGNAAVMGVRVDAERNVLWATMGGIPQMAGFLPSDSTIASLARIRISDGTIERRWNLPPGKSHALGDLVVGPAGDVFITDSYQPILYRLRPNADTLETLTSPIFRSLQGLAATPDGRFVYLADYSHGLLRVDLSNQSIIRLAEPRHVTTLGVDGIVLYRGSIIAVQNGVAPARVMRFKLDKTGTRIERADIMDRNWEIADEPTIGTLVSDEFVYVANSQWEKYTNDGKRKTGVPLTAPTLLAIKLK